MPDSDATPQHIHRLAAVVLHVLVAEKARTFEPICYAVERDPRLPAERSEVEQALAVLVADNLAVEQNDEWTPTRAAVRAAELSF
jgi:hypothetical protein